MFPQNWEVSERIAIQFCHDTREELSKIMSKRKNEIDVKLLLYAIQKTAAFENLLSRRFTGVTINESHEIIQKNTNTGKGQGDIREEGSENDLNSSPFHGLIGKHLIYNTFSMFLRNSYCRKVFHTPFRNLHRKCRPELIRFNRQIHD